MATGLTNRPEVWALARDLGLKHASDPLGAIVRHARQKIRGFVKECPCETLDDLLALSAVMVDTLFVEIHTDDELEEIKQKYLALHEVSFADLEHQLSPDVYAITYRRLATMGGDRKFISLIDCRGEKAARRYFSKWHEIAHLLTLTPQQRLKFCRSHANPDTKDPEESVMDVIAGELGFFDGIGGVRTKARMTFATIESLRRRHCPDASVQASTLGFVQAALHPTVYVEAALALKKSEQMGRRQSSFSDLSRRGPTPVLRAVNVVQNESARALGLFIPRNMRVPARSIVSKILIQDETGLLAREDLSWWESEGMPLAELPIAVECRRFGDRVQALISGAD